MAFGIYKPGQGYWVRVMTAVYVGLVVLGGAAWLWQETGAIRLPVANWYVTLDGVVGEASTGQTAEIVQEINPETGELRVIGTAIIDDYTAGARTNATVMLSEVEVGDDDALTPGQTLRVGETGETMTAAIRSVRSESVFQIIYLQATAVGALMLVAAASLYWLVGVKRGPVDFLIATDGEMKKVNWSTRKDIYGSTIVVVTASILIAGGLFCVDYLFSWFFRLIGVLD